MSPVLVLIIAGLCGALVMAAVVLGLQYLGFTRAEMLGAIGSIITKSQHHARQVGFAIHLASGIIFAFLYAYLWSYFDFRTVSDLVKLGLITGFAHGLFVSFWLVILVAEHHPLQQYQRVGFKVALAHVLGHIAYGLTLGYTMGVFEDKYNTLSSVSHFVHRTATL